ncbi:carboxylate--amine ligase [Halegenticoccus soli]|uniref:carboxylate--amine ligase n=1 Tax=Halegenticoccus soli TaxID=1985678 RepID=UPI000C6CAC06|nr:ATP-grasp domain-containing protein [Halegenticoccus soli]
MSNVLVLDAQGPAALSVIRSLGEKEISITAGSSSRYSLGALSRFAPDRYVHPDPRDGCEAFIEHLREYLAANDFAAVLPVSDQTTLLCARHKHELEQTGTRVAAEDWGRFRRMFDKGRFFDLVADLDVPAPETHQPRSLADVANLAPELSYPVVVKYRSKTALDRDTYYMDSMSDENYVHSERELLERYEELLAQREHLVRHPPLIQEYVPGTTTSTVVLADDGDISAHFQQRRVRTYPTSGGNSALLAAVREPKMLAYAERVIDALEWTGPAMVEFMQHGDEFYVIEMNGRYWGSVPFAVQCGVDFPWLHYQQLRGKEPQRISEYRTDIRMQRLLYEELKWLRENVANGNVTAIGSFISALFRAKHSILSWDDPLPAFSAVGWTGVLGARTLVDQFMAEDRARTTDVQPDPTTTMSVGSTSESKIDGWLEAEREYDRVTDAAEKVAATMSV